MEGNPALLANDGECSGPATVHKHGTFMKRAAGGFFADALLHLVRNDVSRSFEGSY